MSFILRLFNKKENKGWLAEQQQQKRQQTQQQQQHVEAADALYTQEADGFVNICHSLPRGDEEGDADISDSEMAKVLGRNLDKKLAQREKGDFQSIVKVHKAATKDVTDHKVLAVAQNKPQPVQVADVTPMEDSLELDMYDDKRNRIIKRSNRRKFNFETRIKC